MNKLWKDVKLSDLFQINSGSKMDFSKMTFDNPTVSFIGRSALFNGHNRQKVDLIEGTPPYKAGSITVALGGSIGSTFLQEEPFYTSQNVSVLIPLKKHNMNKYHKLFIITILKYHFSLKFVAFGRELNRYIKNDIVLSLPHKCNGELDWEFMEKKILEIKEIEKEKIRKRIISNAKKVGSINEQIWKEYKIVDLFDVETVTYHQAKTKYEEGNVPYITQTAINNGVETYVDPEFFQLEKGNCITIGSIGLTAFYQKESFLSDLKIYKLYANNLKGSKMNEQIGLFISTIINMEQFKYGYGRQFYSDNVRNTKIALPSVYDKYTKTFSPDWSYMEEYIKNTNNNVIKNYLEQS